MFQSRRLGQKAGISTIPMFAPKEPVVVQVKFFMRRPDTHFKNRARWNPLKAILPYAFVATPDIDNLVKFVLDGMNGLVYKDDKQVVKLVAYKLYDSESDCGGRTVVEVTEFDEHRLSN